jgi:hypothetical protein
VAATVKLELKRKEVKWEVPQNQEPTQLPTLQKNESIDPTGSENLFQRQEPLKTVDLMQYVELPETPNIIVIEEKKESPVKMPTIEEVCVDQPNIDKPQVETVPKLNLNEVTTLNLPIEKKKAQAKGHKRHSIMSLA